MPTRLLFGQGAVENLGFECSLNGWASALIVTDAGVHKAGLTQPVEAQLQAQGVRYRLYTGVVPNPTIESIEAAVPDAQAVDVVIAVGGGSVMDSAKLIKRHPHRMAGACATTRATGHCPPRRASRWSLSRPPQAQVARSPSSRCSPTPAKRQKMARAEPLPRAPTWAIVDPEMTRKPTPLPLRRRRGWDALTHAIEGDCRSAGRNPFLGYAGVSRRYG
jgi:alcohol dehydrogenase class IV